jgi:hypothetical protein
LKLVKEISRENGLLSIVLVYVLWEELKVL